MQKKIIIAEDSLTQATTLQFMLEEMGYQADIARDGVAALELIETTMPDLVISDIIMPGMDGYTLCNRIKTNPSMASIPVILLSSLSDPADVIRGLSAGADNFVTKPIDEGSLGKVVKELLLKDDSGEIDLEFTGNKVTFKGETYRLAVSPKKIFSFLLTTYDTAIAKNKALLAAQNELNDLNQTLEEKVRRRTAELATEVEVRKKTEQSLRERERVIREITENVRELVFKTDLDGVYRWVNSAHMLTLGYNEEELIGLSFFDFVHPEDRDEIIRFFRERKEEGGKYTAEYKFLHPQGHFVWMECSPNFIPGEHSEDGYFVFAAHEITERKDFENELIYEREQAKKSDLLKSSFLANMSHDIRTPMNAIIGFTELLKEKDVDEKQQQKFLEQITRNGESLLNLVNDIIDISKIEAGVLTIHKTPCPVNHICQELLDFYSRYLALKEKKQLSLSFEPGFEDPNQQIVTDPLRFRQIMSNLLNNAIKFTSEGTVSFGYTLTDVKTLQFFVRDSGIGIPREEHDRIFNQFTRVEAVMEQNQGGTGLGLTISRNLVMLMGGKMWVESKVGQGSSFFFTLPYEPVKETYRPRTARPNQLETPDFSNRIILIVEDDVSSYSYLQAALTRIKAQIIWAKDGAVAVQCCRENPGINLVLMDIQLPKLTGFEATPMIKQIRPDLPVIAQTAYSMSGEEQKCYESGCDDYLSKPIIPRDLVQKVSKYLGNANVKENT